MQLNLFLWEVLKSWLSTFISEYWNITIIQYRSYRYIIKQLLNIENDTKHILA